jgi:hypothetical protein
MSDRDLSPEDLARVRTRQVIQDELSRAGIELPQEQVEQITNNFLSGAENNRTREMLALLELGQGRGFGPANQGTASDDAMAFPQLFGQAPEDLWAKQRENWDGYGWTDAKIRTYGRNPEPRELSVGGRAANSWEANKRFLEGLLQQDQSVQRMQLPGIHFGPDGVPGPGPAPEEVRTLVLSGLLDEHDRVRKQTHGESGFFGALLNPEYTAGRAFGEMAKFGEAAHMQVLDTDRPQPGDVSSSPVTAGRLFRERYYPRAEAQRQVLGLKYNVEPTLPAGATPAEGNQEIALAAERRNLTLDELTRLGSGQYPSYLASGVATFLNGLLDPSIAATGPAARATHMIGRGLSGAGQAVGKGTLGGNFLRRWGSNLMRDANWARKYPYAAAAMREAADEAPFGAGIQGAGAATNPQTPHVGTWDLPGNQARTDLHVYDPELHKLNPETNGMRAETDKEFRERTTNVMNHSVNMTTENNLLMDRVRHSRLPEAPKPAYSMPMNGRVVP